MTNLEIMKDFLVNLESMDNKELANYITNNYDHYGGEGYPEKPNTKVYVITDDYMIKVHFSNHDIYEAYYSITKEETGLGLENYEITDVEEFRDFYQFHFEKIDLELLRLYLENNKEELIEEIKEKIESLQEGE